MDLEDIEDLELCLPGVRDRSAEPGILATEHLEFCAYGSVDPREGLALKAQDLGS